MGTWAVSKSYRNLILYISIYYRHKQFHVINEKTQLSKYAVIKPGFEFVSDSVIHALPIIYEELI